MAKHIGIIAVSPPGAALCYETICHEGAALMERHRHPEITMHSIPLADHMACVESSNWQGLAQLMVTSAEKLIDVGAELLICPDNTNHLAFDEAVSQINVQWLHIAQEVVVVAKDASYAKVGIIGTKFLMESRIYPDKLERYNIAWSIPTPTQRGMINSIIFDELVYSNIVADSQNYLCEAIHELGSKGCDAVILGCTELPLIINERNSSLPPLDSTRILARAALRESVATEPIRS